VFSTLEEFLGVILFFRVSTSSELKFFIIFSL
jgi:hypothetical protein